MKKAVFLVVAFLLGALSLFAEGTHTWKQTSFEDFERGTTKGVAIRSNGTLVLAPAFKLIYTSPSTYIWAIASDGEGNVYAAAGSPARVYRITPNGQSSVVFEPKELEVQALVVDTSGVLYAATSPDGKVYKIERRKPEVKSKSKKPFLPEPETEGVKSAAGVDLSFTSSTFFDPQRKYIWDLALDPKGELYVATGDRGEVFRVSRTGEGSVFFKSDEAHIRVLAFDTKGNLIAGSDGSGLVYRISPSGEAFVLYSAPKKEITALAIDGGGNIFAAGIGEKHGPSSNISFPLPPPSSPTVTSSSGVPSGSSTPPSPAQPSAPFSVAGGSEIYKIAPDGSPSRLWTSHDDIVYTLGFDERGRLLAGTGNKGRIFAVAGEGEYTDLLKASANQVTAISKAPNGGLYVATSNLGKIFLLGAAPDSEGTYDSDVFDARTFSRWGRAEVLASGSFDLYERSGNVDNPDRNWSPWRKVDLLKDVEPDVPPARFIQWRAVLHPGSPSARIESVTLNYRPNNVAPVVDNITVQVGVRYQSVPKPPGGEASPTSGGQQRFDSNPPATRDRDSISVHWSAHDDNDDELIYSLYYKGDNETQWKLLKDKITEKYYSWDASLFPDGGYIVKVIASDAPSHSPDEALTAEKESSRFEVDTTPPRVEGLHATMENGELHVTFRAADDFSPIKRAEYSIDAGDWQFVEPVGLISDSRVENYDVTVPAPGGQVSPSQHSAVDPPLTKAVKKSEAGKRAAPMAEHVIVVRVYDRFDNMGSAKTVLRVTKP